MIWWTLHIENAFLNFLLYFQLQDRRSQDNISIVIADLG
jgi:hypothetical protein